MSDIDSRIASSVHAITSTLAGIVKYENSHRDSSTDDPVDEKIVKTIDIQLQKLTDILYDLRSRRNTLAPSSSRLPPEILARIFLSCALSERGMSRIKVTHVCRHWRLVALDCSNLWNRIAPSRPELVKEMLARSKSSLLFVTYNPTIHCSIGHRYVDKKKIASIAVALPHIARFQELNLYGDRPTLETFISDLTHTAPVLQSLSLACSDDDYCTIPGSFLNGVAPKLHTLSLMQCGLSWKSPLLANRLVKLFIDTPPLKAQTTIPVILKMLSNCPLLETLQLSNVVSSAKNPRPSAAELTVHLPRLSKFILSASTTHCGILLASIQFPSTATLVIECDDSPNNIDLSKILPILSAFQNLPSDEESLPRLDILYRPKGISFFLYFADTFAIHFRVKWHVRIPTPCLRVTIDVCKALSVHCPHSIKVEGACSSMLPGTWKEALQNFTQTQVLSATGNLARGLVKAMDVEEYGDVFLPRTRTLEFREVNFYVDEEAETSIDPFHDLTTTLRNRCKYKAPLHRLEIHSCLNFGQDNVDELEDLVEELHWDSFEDYPSGNEEFEYDSEDDLMFF